MIKKYKDQRLEEYLLYSSTEEGATVPTLFFNRL